MPKSDKHGLSPWRLRLHVIIFEADTPAGKAFDMALLVAILSSIIVVMLDSVEDIASRYGALLGALEWMFTILFTIEYVLRLVSVSRPLRYVFSFYGVIDLMAILPTYLSLIMSGAESLLVLRSLRLLRIFRVLKLAHYLSEANVLASALRSSGPKVLVFLGTVLSLVLIMGTMMYLVEGEENGFTSIPRSMYWAIVTMTTVGYGDIAPQTVLGQVLASVVMILGYSIIAVPTGIVSAELGKVSREKVSTRACLECSLEGHDADARHCKYCGAAL
ncbi:MAG: ion transporter [SAR324 cluster bacterium]|nr:ion transporter [SAR324 cluster bacterium]